MIPLLAILGVAIAAVAWPGPKVDARKNDSGAIFAPQIMVMEQKTFTASAYFTDAPQGKAPIDPYENATPLIPSSEGKRPQ